MKFFFYSRTFLAAGVLAALVCSTPAFSVPLQISYGARLTDTSGNPVTLSGGQGLRITFWDAQTNGNQKPGAGYDICADGSSCGASPPVSTFINVTLTNGAFQVMLVMSAANFHTVFPDTGTSNWIQVELVNYSGTTVTGVVQTFARQQFASSPYSLKVPVDGASMSFSASGQLQVGTTGTLPLSKGGTGLSAASNSALLSGIGAAASGNNSDITALSSGNVGIGALASANAALDVVKSETASSGAAYGIRAQETLTAAANNDSLNALYINPTFNDAGRSGVTHNALIVASGSVGIGTTAPSQVYSLTAYANTSSNGTGPLYVFQQGTGYTAYFANNGNNQTVTIGSLNYVLDVQGGSSAGPVSNGASINLKAQNGGGLNSPGGQVLITSGNATGNGYPGGIAFQTQNGADIASTYTNQSAANTFPFGNTGALSLRPTVTATSAGPYAQMSGLISTPMMNGTGTTLTNVYGGYFRVDNTAGTITNAYGAYVAAPAYNTGTTSARYALATEAGAGNVGIGVTAPLAPLDVNGNAFFRGNVGIGSSSPVTALDVANTTSLTTLNGAITAVSPANGGALTVVSTAGYPSSGILVMISSSGYPNMSEAISYTGTTPTTFTGITRGVLGTTATTVASGATVDLIITKISNSSSVPSFVTTAGGNTGLSEGAPVNVLDMSGTITSGASAFLFRPQITGGSTYQVALNGYPAFSPTAGAAGAFLYGGYVFPYLQNSSTNLLAVAAWTGRVDMAASYTGTLSNGYGFLAKNPVVNAANPITAYSGFASEAFSNGNGITSGSISNYGYYTNGSTASPALGGTITNTGVSITMPSGSGAGTTSNFGVAINGNGGTGGSGATNNASIWNNSNAWSWFAAPINEAGTYYQADRITFNAQANYYVINNASVGVRLGNGATAWAAQSDRRLKRDISSIGDALDKLNQIDGVTYNYCIDPEGTPRRAGVIAQDVQKVLPEAVDKDEKGFLSVKYTEMIPLVINAVKELFAKWSSDHEDLVRAQALIQDQQRQIDRLTASLCETNPNAAVCGR